MGYLSKLFFSSPSFLEGMARLVDFHGDLNSQIFCANPDEVDALALASDWNAVRHEIDQAAETLRTGSANKPQVITDGKEERPSEKR
jgi:hypothetical protein